MGHLYEAWITLRSKWPQNVSTTFLDNLCKLIEIRRNGRLYEESFETFAEPDDKSVVAFSGDVSSLFSLIMAKKSKLNPISMTLVFNELPEKRLKFIENVNQRLGVESELVDDPQLLSRIQDENGMVYCDSCQKELNKSILDYCRKNNLGLVMIGDRKSKGVDTIRIYDGLVRIGLPGMLDIDKDEMIKYLGRENFNHLSYHCIFSDYRPKPIHR